MTSIAYDEFCSERTGYPVNSHPQDDFQEFLDDHDRFDFESPDGWVFARFEVQGIKGERMIVKFYDVRDWDERYGKPSQEQEMTYSEAEALWRELTEEGWE